jgi:hypothetical protein
MTRPQERYQQRIARGVCTRCGEVPVPEDRRRCLACRIADARYYARRAYRAKLARVRAKVGRAA